MNRMLLLVLFSIAANFVAGQEFRYVSQDLRDQWLMYEHGEYKSVDAGEVSNSIYFRVQTNEPSGRALEIVSSRPFFVFFDGRLAGEYQGRKIFRTDSLSEAFDTGSLLVTVYQKNINIRDLETRIMSDKRVAVSSAQDLSRPKTYFTDFVILAGLLIMILFVIIVRLNPKLASDYFALAKIFSTREVDDAQSNARLTNGSNVQFYILCSLLIGFYLMVIFRHLPVEYRAPMYFQANGFWSAFWQWMQLSGLVLAVFFVKILLIFALTRLFDMRGLTRVHFFNWVRLMLLMVGVCSVILFIYFISRGQDPDIFVIFMALVVAIMVAWLFIVFLKLSSKSEHSMFHLFSYICATELIPLLITIKVLFH